MPLEAFEEEGKTHTQPSIAVLKRKVIRKFMTEDQFFYRGVFSWESGRVMLPSPKIVLNLTRIYTM